MRDLKSGWTGSEMRYRNTKIIKEITQEKGEYIMADPLGGFVPETVKMMNLRVKQFLDLERLLQTVRRFCLEKKNSRKNHLSIGALRLL